MAVEKHSSETNQHGRGAPNLLLLESTLALAPIKTRQMSTCPFCEQHIRGVYSLMKHKMHHSFLKKVYNNSRLHTAWIRLPWQRWR